MERRQEKRYRAIGRAFAVTIPEQEENLACHIVDISKSGLALRYPGEVAWMHDVSGLSLCINDDSYVENIPVVKVSDTQMDNGFIPMRRQGVKFESLSSEQEIQLDEFISMYTVGGA